MGYAMTKARNHKLFHIQMTAPRFTFAMEDYSSVFHVRQKPDLRRFLIRNLAHAYYRDLPMTIALVSILLLRKLSYLINIALFTLYNICTGTLFYILYTVFIICSPCCICLYLGEYVPHVVYVYTWV